MTSTIKLKKSSVSGNKPGTSDLEYGELAINFADGKLFYKNSSNQIRSFVDSGLVQSLSLDSSEVINLVDSAYVQARQTVSTFDSDSVTNLVDSAYIQDRQMGVGFNLYEYNATDNQTTFEDSDIAGNVLSYSQNNILVHYNGVLLSTTEYTATDGSSVVLDDAADSGAIIMIARWKEGGQDSASGSSGSYGGGGSSGGSGNAWSGDRGLIGGGETANNGTSVNVINYIDITTTGNAQDFGDLTGTRESLGALSNQTRGVFCGGNSDGARSNVMDYVTVATTGNAQDFGDLTSTKNAVTASSNGTIGIIAGGLGSGSYPNNYKNEIESITVATTGNATDFGDMTYQAQMPTSFADATRGVIAGGYSTAAAGDVTMNYITFASAGNAQDFGDLSQGRYRLGSCSDSTRGVTAGGGTASSNGVNTMDYVAIQTTGNAVDFGDLTQERQTSGMANATRGVFASGDTNSTFYNVLDYITIQTTGNAADFGDNTDTYGKTASCSGSAS
jgi:hypothetical protein|tara:strand:- start:6421 stop:7929 length:1509 start_codon:yes stop_codon:yes gene_type:complete